MTLCFIPKSPAKDLSLYGFRRLRYAPHAQYTFHSSLFVYMCPASTVAPLVCFQPINPIFEGNWGINFEIHVICRPVIDLQSEQLGTEMYLLLISFPSHC